MKVEFGKLTLKVTREDTDPKFYGIKHAAGESQFLYHLKQKLNQMTEIMGMPAIPFIKKRMHKDGHLVDEMQQCLRSKRPYKDLGYLYIYNGRWDIEGAEQIFNEGVVCLMAVYADGAKESEVLRSM